MLVMQDYYCQLLSHCATRIPLLEEGGGLGTVCLSWLKCSYSSVGREHVFIYWKHYFRTLKNVTLFVWKKDRTEMMNKYLFFGVPNFCVSIFPLITLVFSPSHASHALSWISTMYCILVFNSWFFLNLHAAIYSFPRSDRIKKVSFGHVIACT